MTNDHWLVYEYMVKQFGGISFDSADAFAQALVSDGEVTKRFVPCKTWGMYNIDKQTILAVGYLCRYGFDLIKVKNGEIAEYYRRLVSGKNAAFVAYDLETLEVLEHYNNVEKKLWKYDSKTGDELQANNSCTYATLPEDYQSMVKDFQYKKSVFMYAQKPYGRVVEFYYPKQ